MSSQTEISVSRAYGLIYMATHVIERQGLIEKHAARLRQRRLIGIQGR